MSTRPKPVPTLAALSLACTAVFVIAARAATPILDNEGWPAYGRDAGGNRYSPLDQIDRDNVRELERAWTYHTGELGEGFKSRRKMAFQATPVLLEGRLILSTPTNIVIALDALSGEEDWRFDPEVDRDMHYSEGTSRGVGVWRNKYMREGPSCSVYRVFHGTLDGRLLALDGLTGRPCADFGVEGQVDLTVGVRLVDPGDYLVTSPPVILGDALIIGSAIGDNRAVEVELGIVRAYDVVSGKLLWSWDPIPRDPGDPFYEEWGEEAARRNGAANAWAPLSVDVERSLVFVPTTSSAPDFYGGERPGTNRYANSLVALDGRSGEIVWHRQLVHHDLWDYDLPAQPVLANIRLPNLESGDGTVPVVIQATKMGLVFVFHRDSGKPIFGMEERPVPQQGVPGEWVSPTQPFPLNPPPLVSHAPVTGEDAWGLTFWDRGKCREAMARHRSEGLYTPPSLEGTLLFPGYAGGVNWGGVSFDRHRQIAVTNVMNIAMMVRLIPREKLEDMIAAGEIPDRGFSAQRGTPYVMQRYALLSPWGLPCNPPPWGELIALDMSRGEILWREPLGTIEDLAPAIVPNLRLGVPNMGGSIVTKGGLIFIGAAADDYLRAFDIETGEELWRARLPAGGQATPMTYAIDGKQYVVIAAGGHGNLGTRQGDAVVAFSLPD